MKFQYIKALTFALTVCSLTAHAKTSVSEPWARATVAGQVMGGAFVNLTSDQPAQLVGVSSPVAVETQLHGMSMQGEGMQMKQVPSIDLPANQTVSLRPGSYHIMLMGLKKPLVAGSIVPIQLKVKTAKGNIEVLRIKVPVKILDTHMMSHSHGM
mgnify:CR=1 FL=1